MTGAVTDMDRSSFFQGLSEYNKDKLDKLEKRVEKSREELEKSIAETLRLKKELKELTATHIEKTEDVVKTTFTLQGKSHEDKYLKINFTYSGFDENDKLLEDANGKLTVRYY